MVFPPFGNRTLFKRCNIKLITCYNLYKLGTFKSVVDLTRLGIKLGLGLSIRRCCGCRREHRPYDSWPWPIGFTPIVLEETTPPVLSYDRAVR